MALEIVAGTDLAQALQGDIEQKLSEWGWTSDGLDAGSMAEYIVLMLGNDKTQEEIAREIGTDLLQLPEDDPKPLEFVQWLFRHAQELNNPSAPAQQSATTQPELQTEAAHAKDVSMGDQDADMGDGSQDTAIPTGPKSMRNGPQKARDRRMPGHMNRNLDRPLGADLHRIKGATGNGRINSHVGKPPTGPRAARQQQNRQMAMNNMMQQTMPGGPNLTLFSPEQQMQLFALYEQQTSMMAQMLSPQQQQQLANQFAAANGMNMNMNPRGGLQNGKSLADRIEKRGRRPNGNFPKRNQQNGDAMETEATEVPMDPASSMEVENGSQNNRPPPWNTVCKFNIRCKNPDCPFAHQSPAAPPDSTFDVEDECQFGVACQNRKCSGKHPSPAKKNSHIADQFCKFYPNCTNASCPFKHPEMPYCRNGADCTTEGCKYTHIQTPCKFNPCYNPRCPYKHLEGQKQKVENKTWVNPEAANNADGSEPGFRTSDRKFVDENAGEEEVILPGRSDAGGDEATAPPQDQTPSQSDGIIA